MHMAVCPGKVLATRLHTARGQGTKTRGGGGGSKRSSGHGFLAHLMIWLNECFNSPRW